MLDDILPQDYLLEVMPHPSIESFIDDYLGFLQRIAHADVPEIGSRAYLGMIGADSIATGYTKVITDNLAVSEIISVARIIHGDTSVAYGMAADGATLSNFLEEIEKERGLKLDLDRNATAEMMVIVHPSYQGKGLGSILLYSLMKSCHDQGYNKNGAIILALNSRMRQQITSYNRLLGSGQIRQFYHDGEYVSILTCTEELIDRFGQALYERQKSHFCSSRPTNA
jgi:GNAT superfamily N-acetyltransferase